VKKDKNIPHQFNSISELHRVLGLPKPLHPLVSLVDNTRIGVNKDQLPASFSFNFYKVSFKKTLRGKIRYGQGYYDTEYLGYTLLIHPDFIRNFPLGKNIHNFGFFSYSVNEALHLSEKEKTIIFNIFRNIEEELQSAIDDFSQNVIVAQIELILNYSNRFYKRQFITRKAVNNDLLAKLENLLSVYFNNETSLMKGLPTVQYLAEQLNVSSHYLGDMLRSLTGQNAQQHIHNKLIEKAKEMLSGSNLSVAEIAYQLGFEHPQSFNKLFKSKTNLAPSEFRQSFN
jgi:AraC family transcriptional activator of pobA